MNKMHIKSVVVAFFAILSSGQFSAFGSGSDVNPTSGAVRAASMTPLEPVDDLLSRQNRFFEEFLHGVACRVDYHSDFSRMLVDANSVADDRLKISRFKSIYELEGGDDLNPDSVSFCLEQMLKEHDEMKGMFREWLVIYIQYKRQLTVSELLSKIDGGLEAGIKSFRDLYKHAVTKERQNRQSHLIGDKISNKKVYMDFVSESQIKSTQDVLDFFTEFRRKLRDLFPRPVKPKKDGESEVRSSSFLPSHLQGEKSTKKKPARANGGKKGAGVKVSNAQSKAAKKPDGNIEGVKTDANAIVPQQAAPAFAAADLKPMAAAVPMATRASAKVEGVDVATEPISLVDQLIARIGVGEISIDDYFENLTTFYQKNKESIKNAAEQDKGIEPALALTRVISRNAFITLQGIYSKSLNVSWDELVTLIKSLGGSVLGNSGSANTITFEHPFSPGRWVSFALHNPHPRPNLYEDLMERFIKNFSRYGLSLENFTTKSAAGE